MCSNFGEPTDLPPASAPPADQPPPPPTGGAPVIAADNIVAPGQYPPNGVIVVDQTDVQVGGEVAVRGSGCVPGETLSVLFDGAQVGTMPSDSGGNFAGSVTVPAGTNPGQHLITVRGSGCELNAVVTVVGAGATRSLAFTGSSSTLTYVLVGLAAVMFGGVLVLGTRRRRASTTSPGAGPPSG